MSFTLEFTSAAGLRRVVDLRDVAAVYERATAAPRSSVDMEDEADVASRPIAVLAIPGCDTFAVADVDFDTVVEKWNAAKGANTLSE